MLERLSPSDQALAKDRNDNPNMATPEDEPETDSDCEDEHEGGVSLIDHKDDMDLDEQPHTSDQPLASPPQSTSTVEDGQQDNISLLEPPDEQPERTIDSADDVLPDAELTAFAGALPDHVAVHDTQGTSFTPFDFNAFLMGDIEGVVAGDPTLFSYGPLDSHDHVDVVSEIPNITVAQSQDPIPVQHSIHSNVSGDSFPEFEHAESAFDEPYPQMLPWYANTLAYQYGSGFFGSHDERKNMSFLECLRFWRDGYALQQRNPKHCPLKDDAFSRLTNKDIHRGMRARKRSKLNASDLHQEKCDLQGIDWTEMNVTRQEARCVRRKTYFNHANLITSGRRHWSSTSGQCSLLHHTSTSSAELKSLATQNRKSIFAFLE